MVPAFRTTMAATPEWVSIVTTMACPAQCRTGGPGGRRIAGGGAVALWPPERTPSIVAAATTTATIATMILVDHISFLAASVPVPIADGVRRG
jgi:hypothetical protein